MCGIAGAFFSRDTTEARRAPSVVEAMTGALGHRGPDGAGLVEMGGLGTSAVLGHRRLAIIDLSDRGAQPMRSATEPISITFNGEIYNFAAIRRELERAGRRFCSQSDTEVVLQGYEEWGADVVPRLHGMFAFGIYDGRRGHLLLARDRLGIKPLYVADAAGALLFASEVRALLASGLVARRLDDRALDDYLAYQTAPTPRTLVKGIRLIEPGHLLVAGPTGRTTERRYWDFLANSHPLPASTTAAEAREEVHRRLRQSVAGHLISDVPVGVFLSGGVDSTALVAIAHEIGATPRTFTVAMPGTAHDEAPYARLVAERFGYPHTEVMLSELELAARVPEALESFDHPTGDGINTFVVSRAVRAAGITVALSGVGGDEIFGGYPSFERLRRIRAYARWWRRSPKLMRSAASAVRSLGGASVATEKAASVLEGDGSVARAYPILRQVFSRKERAALLGESAAGIEHDAYEQLLAAAVERHPDRDLTSLVSYAEARTYMHDVLLRDGDQMSMAHGLELRVPLLDHELVEYVVGLPEALKAPRGLPKRLLIEAAGVAGSGMPLDAVNRPKRGFVLPFDTWMRGDLRELCAHHLGPDGVVGRGGLSARAVDALWHGFLAGDGRTTWSRPWTLVALGAWLDRHAISA
jgi:asparagine synthase (glutamine-hydrolysing)